MMRILRVICWTLAAAAALCTWASYADSGNQAGQAMPIDGLFTLIGAAATLFLALAGWLL